MFDHGFGPDIRKFLAPLKNRTLKPGDQGFQTILVAATMTKVIFMDVYLRRKSHNGLLFTSRAVKGCLMFYAFFFFLHLVVMDSQALLDLCVINIKKTF